MVGLTDKENVQNLIGTKNASGYTDCSIDKIYQFENKPDLPINRFSVKPAFWATSRYKTISEQLIITNT